jgi:hypothetical protein
MIPDLPVAPRVKVTRDEQTCTLCGETTSIGYCVRCNEDLLKGGSKANRAKRAGKLVPTTSYLKPEEYEVI